MAHSSTMQALGSNAPDFRLPNHNSTFSADFFALEDFKTSQALLVAFICNHCPYVVHLRQGLVDFARDYELKRLAVVAISANDVSTHPQDAPAKMADAALEFGFGFPYLFDETQAVAQAYQAACTPDFFLYDRDRALFYRGQFDDSRPNNGQEVTGSDLRRALDALLAGDPPPTAQSASIGCNIKWKAGQEPDYFSA